MPRRKLIGKTGHWGCSSALRAQLCLIAALVVAGLWAEGAVLAAGRGETAVLERLDPERAPGESVIHLRFNVPVRFVSLSSSPDDRVLQVLIQPVPISGFDADALAVREELSWQPSDEMPLERVIYEGIDDIDDDATQVTRRGQQATLVFQFSQAVSSYQLLDDKDFRGFRLVLPVIEAAEPVAPAAPQPVAPVIALPELELPARTVIEVAPEPVSTLPPLAHPKGRYVVNLLSSEQPIDGAEHAPLPLEDGYRVYTSEALVKGKPWHRLRLGFFATLAEARTAAAKLKTRFPQNWVDKVRSSERQASVASALAGDGQPLEEITVVAQPAGALPAATVRQSGMLERARRSMTEGDQRRAIRFLTALVEAPEHAHSREALELLGLARERNGQLAQANAVYEDYLQRYPEGESSDRVRQRLVALATAAEQPREPLRKARREEEEAAWEYYGSIAQYYRRESVDSDLGGSDTTQSELDSSVIASARYRGKQHDMRGQFTGSYTNDFLESEDSEGRISELYFDWLDRQRGYSVRAGRQRHNTSGTLGRFDGVIGGYRFSPQLRINAVIGRPVENSGDIFINDEQRFYGLSADLGTYADHWDFSVFAIEQETEGVIDRRAIGGELRYFDENRSLFSAVDYDLEFEELNTLLLLGNWTFDDNTTAYLNLDYRNSPTLVTRNALINQPVDSLDELGNTFTLEQIRELALDRTQRARLLSIGGSRPLSEDLQVSADVTLSNLQETETSGGVEAVPGTENEYYYTAQLIRSNLFKRGDIGILGVQYADGDLFDTFSLNLNSRYPISSGWRINPRVRLAHRKGTSDGSTRITLAPLLRMEYRLRRQLAFELELGGDWHENEDASGAKERSTEYHFNLGYRWDY